ncbi:MAG TPA: hypothetical protein EYO58_06045 [Flavobacteriales bacterium]|nr:hypothetical protein [Flavobacteriales bacterium]
MVDSKFTWTPERVKEFTAIYAGNFSNKASRFGYSDFIGLKYDEKVRKYERLVTSLEGDITSKLSTRFPTEGSKLEHPFSTIRRWIVGDIMARIVLPNMGWRAQSDEAVLARREIGEAVDGLVNDIDFHFQPDD